MDLVDLSLSWLAPAQVAEPAREDRHAGFRELVVLNKFEKRSTGTRRCRDVRRQVARNRKLFKTPPEELPVFPTIAGPVRRRWSRTSCRGALCARLHAEGGRVRPWRPEGLARAGRRAHAPGDHPGRACGTSREIPAGGRATRRAARSPKAAAAGRARGLCALETWGSALPAALSAPGSARCGRCVVAGAARPTTPPLGWRSRGPETALLGVARAPARQQQRVQLASYAARGTRPETRNALAAASAEDPDAAATRTGARGSRLLLTENLPGSSAYTGGISAYRHGADPAHVRRRGMPERANRRFHYLARERRGTAGSDRVRLDHAVRRRPEKAATSTGASATGACRSRRSTT